LHHRDPGDDCRREPTWPLLCKTLACPGGAKDGSISMRVVKEFIGTPTQRKEFVCTLPCPVFSKFLWGPPILCCPCGFSALEQQNRIDPEEMLMNCIVYTLDSSFDPVVNSLFTDTGFRQRLPSRELLRKWPVGPPRRGRKRKDVRATHPCPPYREDTRDPRQGLPKIVRTNDLNPLTGFPAKHAPNEYLADRDKISLCPQ
jgi:hypothetical protein